MTDATPIEALLAALASEIPQVVSDAAAELGLRRDPAAVPALAALLSSTGPGTPPRGVTT